MAARAVFPLESHFPWEVGAWLPDALLVAAAVGALGAALALVRRRRRRHWIRPLALARTGQPT